MKFLVVDDSVTMRRIILNALERIGYADALEATDGEDALAKFDRSVGFIITDWNMPKLSGLEFTRAVRARADGQTVPILMVTTRGSREDIVLAVDAGVNNYILKPFTPTVLKEKIDALLTSMGVAA